VPCAACSVPAHTLTSRRARSAATARATARAWGLLRSFYSVVGRGSALRYAYGGSDGGPQRLADSPYLMRCCAPTLSRAKLSRKVSFETSSKPGPDGLQT